MKILNPRYQISNGIQKPKVGNQDDKSKCESRCLYSINFHFCFCILRSEEMSLKFGFWDLETSQQEGGENSCQESLSTM
jgi:hypothetical protein